jgi:hypothetical protein
MKVTAITDAGDLRGKLREFEQVVGREASGAVRQHARLACVYLANSTQPYSGKNKDGKSEARGAKAMGERAVEVDVSKVFYHPDSGGLARALTEKAMESYQARAAKSSSAFWSGKTRSQPFNAAKARSLFLKRIETYIAGKNRPALRKILKDFKWQGVIDRIDPALHQQARSGARRKVKKRPGRMYLVLGGSWGAINSYTNKVKKRVGIAKSGWAACATKIALEQKQALTAGIPAWVTRHASGRNGEVKDKSRDAKNPRVTMTNRVPWTSQNLTPNETMKALNRARDNFVKYMNKAIRAELKRQLQADTV